jgi:hypothetical protein
VGPGGQLDQQAAGTLVVASDEKHVAFLRDPSTIEAGCMARGAVLTTGTLVVLELQSDGSACERVVAGGVQAQSIVFSSDARGLAFLNDVDTCGVGKLRTADADGANVRLVHESVYQEQGVGSTVFFMATNEEYVLAAPITGGKTVSLGTLPQWVEPASASNATGRAFVYRNYGTSDNGIADGSLVLRALPSGKSQTLVDGATEQLGNSVWSARGGWLAFCHGPGDGSSAAIALLTLVAADGSTRIDVTTNSTCYGFAFSPDDAWLAYAEPDASGGARLLTYSLKDQSKVVLGVVPGAYPTLAFSEDGASVLVAVDTPPTSVGDAIYAATTAAPGSVRFLVDMVGPLSKVLSAGGHVVVPTGNWTVEVYPMSGGAPVTVAGTEPRFEPGVARPHLLLRQYPPSAITITATDGNAATQHVVPDFVSFATWLGSAAVYGTVPDSSDLVTITALTNAGTVTTLLASEIGSYAWAPTATPTRLFYSRKLASAGGAAGVFYVDVPR